MPRRLVGTGLTTSQPSATRARHDFFDRFEPPAPDKEAVIYTGAPDTVLPVDIPHANAAQLLRTDTGQIFVIT